MNIFNRIFITAALCFASGCHPQGQPPEMEHPRRICVMKGEAVCHTLTLEDDALRRLGAAISKSGVRISKNGHPINVRPSHEEYYSDYRLCVFGESGNRHEARLYTCFPFEVSGAYREMSDASAGYSFRLDFKPLLNKEDTERLYQFIPEWKK